MAKWLWSHSPPSHVDPCFAGIPASANTGYTHRIIPCAGGLGEILGCANWPIEGISETVNDINREVTDFWDTMRVPILFDSFLRQVQATAFSEETFNFAQQVLASNTNAPSYRAWAFYVIQRMGQQGRQGQPSFATPTTRLRRGMNENVSAWLSSVDMLPEIHARLRRVEVRCMDAIECIKLYDHPRAFFYIDPPYLDETRQGIGEYLYDESSEAWHYKLLGTLIEIQGKFMLSGYYSDLYARYSRKYHWRTVSTQRTKSSSRQETKPTATEYIWMNY